MQKTKLSLFLIAALIFASGLIGQGSPDSPFVLALRDGPPVQLIQDQAFNNGFRAFWTCKDFPYDYAGMGHVGECRDYYQPYVNTQGKHYAIHTWPDIGPADYWSDENKFWNFNEGLHRGYSAYNYEFGQPGEQAPAKDLAAHRLEANQDTENGVITGGLYGVSSDLIWLQSMNNLSPLDPRYGELVRTVSSDRHGTIMMYMNTKNEIRNVAYENSASFAYDTWPHFGLEQNFKKIVDLATVDAVTMSANVELPLAQFLDGWSTPNGFQSIDFGVGYGLRRKDNPAIEIFLGYPLYSDCRLEGYSDCFDGNIQGRFSADQFGQIFYSGPASDLGGAIPAAQSGDGVHNPNNYRYIWFELRALFDKAQTVAASTSYQDPNLEAGRLSFLQTRIEDYYLAGFGFGWETLGYQHVQSYLSGVSVYALPKMIFDSEVYEESADPNQPSTYKIFNDPNGPNNEGQMRAHWAKYGCHEGRVASTTFDVKIYMDRWGAPGETPTSTSTYNYMPQCYNADGSRNYECAIDHYVIYGRLYGHYGNWFSGGGGGGGEQY